MKKIFMNCVHASPTEVLDAGKVYLVSDELAKALTVEGSGADGKPAARFAKGKELEKVRRVPEKPDPGEDEADVDEDEDDEAEVEA